MRAFLFIIANTLQGFLLLVGRCLPRQSAAILCKKLGVTLSQIVVPRYARDNLKLSSFVGRCLLRQKAPQNYHKNSGFTLLEVMMVVMVVGIMASFVQFNIAGDTPEKQVKKASGRFVAIFDAAAEYGLLNNVELGLFIKNNSYQFLGYDGVRWSDIAEQPLLAEHNLPEGLKISLVLDDLPIEEPLLFDANALIEQQKDNEEIAQDSDSKNSKDNDQQDDKNQDKGKNTQRKKRIPQVYLLSGGDISAFSLTFSLSDEALDALDLAPEENIAYRVMGLYSTPLKVERVDTQGEVLE